MLRQTPNPSSRLRLLPVRNGSDGRISLFKLQTNTINTMPLIRRRRVSLSLEHMTQMASTITTHNLNPLHPKRAVRMSRYRTRNSVKERRPSAAGLELLVGGVEWCAAGGAVVGAGGWVVFVVFAGKRCFSAFLADDAKLVYRLSASRISRFREELY